MRIVLYESIVDLYLGKMKELLAGPKHKFSGFSEEVSKGSGVYAVYDNKSDRILYIGRTGNLRRRLLGDHKRGNVEGSHFRKALGRRFTLRSEDEISSYITENCSFQFIEINEFEEMVRLEHFTTSIIAPILNIKLRQ